MKKFLFLLLFMSLLFVGVALAETSAPPKVDSGDTSWILISSALVMLMTPGTCPLLWRHGQNEECPGYGHAELYRPWQ